MDVRYYTRFATPVMMERIVESLYSVVVTAGDTTLTMLLRSDTIPLDIRPSDVSDATLYVVSVNLAFEGTDVAIV